MTTPKLHHYVPRFYLSRFTGADSRLQVWDKKSDRVFSSTPDRIAAENNFYRFTDLTGAAKDPLLIEKELARVEGQASSITAEWISRLEAMKPLDRLRISKTQRDWISLFISLQHLRTAELREILVLFALEHGAYTEGISDEERVNLHATLLVNGRQVNEFRKWIRSSLWLFARNDTAHPFITSDNPVCFKTEDNRNWLKAAGVLSKGNYLVYPLTPRLILYCKDGGRGTKWEPLKKFRDRLSPVKFSIDMVDHENSGQVFMASRFVVSPTNDFTFARSFAAQHLAK